MRSAAGTNESLTWNCRGLGNPATVREVRELANKFALAVLCLVETQLDSARAEILSLSFGYNKSFAVSSSGRSGGLVLFWNNEIKLEIQGYSKYHIDAIMSELGTVPWRLSCIYGEAKVADRYKTWDTLRSLAGTSSLPWLAMGDFNEVLRQSEHDGVSLRSQSQMDSFRDALDVCCLHDLGHSGLPWTFEKKVAGGSFTRVRLDRAVVDAVWSSLFPSAQLDHVASACSDHSPIVLNFSEELMKIKGARPFK
ncbi:uncharacterized protein [Aegilops tauschii subsp. strangulata]|uniref:uncharacterized protein n=1 Tax=Aegilops tauschii subsp. strangulata TaxID=200361 RepID=UPI003CC8A6AE